MGRSPAGYTAGMPPSPAQRLLAGGFAALGALLAVILAALVPGPAAHALWLAIPLWAIARAVLSGESPPWAGAAEAFARLGLALLGCLLGGWLLLRGLDWIWPQVVAPDRLYPVLLLAAMVVAACLAQWRVWPALPLLFQSRLAEPEGAALWSRLGERCREISTAPEAYWRHGMAASLLQLLLLSLPWWTPWLQRRLAAWQLALLLLLLLLMLGESLWRLVRSARRTPRIDSALPSFLLDGNPATSGMTDALGEPLAELAGPGAELLAAARRGDAEAVRVALAAGADPDTLPPPEAADQRSPIIAAATAADLGALRALIAAGAAIDRPAAGLTALLAATRDSYSGRIDAVMTLLANGADSQRADAAGNTPLHCAAASRDAGVAQSLLDAGAHIDAINREGLTPLALACEAANWSVAEFLLKRGGHADVEGATPALLFAAAVEGDDARGVKLLLKARARVDARGPLGRSALMVAALADNAEIVEALLAAGAPLAARDEAGRSALLEAARAGARRVLTRLVFHKPDASQLDAQGRDALQLAVVGGNADVECIRLLLALGCDPQHRDGEGRNAVELAVALGRWPLVAAIDPEYPLPSSHQPEEEADAAEDEDTIRPDAPGRLLVRAALQGRFPLFEDLLELPGISAEELCESLLAALPHQDRRYLDALGAAGIDPYARNDGAPSVWERLAACEPLPLFAIDALLEQAPRWPCAAHNLLPGLCAMRDGTLTASAELALLDRVLAAGAELSATMADGRPALLQAIERRPLAFCQRLLGAGAEPEACASAHDNALLALAWARRADALELAPWLIRAGADPARAALDGSTPAAVANLSGQAQLASLLDWPPGAHPRQPLDGRHVAEAGKLGDLATLDRLLALGLDVDGLDDKGATALLHAAGTGRAALVAALLERGADLHRANPRGITPAAAAILAGRQDVLDTLLARGLPLEGVLIERFTPLGLAAACLRQSMVEGLLKRGADADGRAAPHSPLLAVLALVLDLDKPLAPIQAVLERLLAAGASPDRPDRQGIAPLHLLLGAGRAEAPLRDEARLLPILGALLRAGANANACDAEGRTPLHWVCRHGLVPCGGPLLEHGADPRIPDEARRLPIDLLSPRYRIHLGPVLRQAAEAWNRQGRR